MSLHTNIQDGGGSNRLATVTDESAVLVQGVNLPPMGVEIGQAVVFRQFLTNSAGSSDMRVNGSTASQVFYVESLQEFDLYIKSISFIISDAGATLSEFGNIGVLTNGCDFFYSNDQGEVTIADELKTNFSFVRLAGGVPAFGDAGTVFKANNISGSSEGYLPFFDFQSVFGLPWGVKLRAGKSDRIAIRVNDDLSGVDAFNAIAYGFSRR